MFHVDNARNSYSWGSSRAPIFYDSDNTGYYINPDGTSNLYNLTLTGSKHTYLEINPGGGYEAMVRYIGGNGGTAYSWYVGKRTSSQLVGTDGFHFYSQQAGATVSGITPQGDLHASGTMRAPLFYDSNNTTYYVDPDSNSNSAIRVRGGSYHGPNPTWGKYLMVGGDGRNGLIDSTDVASVSVTNGNLHIDAASGFGTYLNFYDGSRIIIGGGGSSETARIEGDGSARFTIYYDWNNTTYYLDPAGQNNIYALTCAASADFNSSVNCNSVLRLSGTAGFNTLNESGVGLKIQGGSNGGVALKLIGGGYANSVVMETPTYGSNIYYNHTGAFGASFAKFNYGGTQVGAISVTSTSTAYLTSSDYRLKENVVPMTGALDRVSLLKPSRFNFIGDDKVVDGFLAHEAAEVVPEAVTGEKDGLDHEGNPEYQGIDQSKLVPLLVGAIQELKAEVEALKQQLNGTN